MNRTGFGRRAQGVIAVVLLYLFSIVPCAYASDVSGQDKAISMTLINTAAAYFIFILGMRIVYLTRGGFLSIGFILITAGITIGWVMKLGFEFLTDSGILASSFDVVSIAEAVGGIALVTGFVLLSEKLKG